MDTTLIFPSHSKPGFVKNVTITIFSDSTVENTEFIQIHLSSNNPHATIDNNKRDAIVAIYDQTGEFSGAFFLHTPLEFPFILNTGLCI